MHLARTVTHCTVAETMQRMSYPEFLLWRAEYKRRPWGDDWAQAGTIAAASVQVWTKRRIRPEQFIPKARPKQSPADIEREMNVWARAHNRSISRVNSNRQPLDNAVRQQHGADARAGGGR